MEIEYSDYKFFFGDLNFRIDGDFKELIDEFEKSGEFTKEQKENLIEKCLKNDQLVKIREAPDTPYLLGSYN